MTSFRFRKKTEYALMMAALLAQAGKGELVSVSKMQEYGLPRSFLVKIARDMIKAGLIVAKEGRGGGYSLVKKPESVSIKQVVEATEGQVATADCLVHGAKKCPLADKCPHRKVMRLLTDEIAQVLEKYKLSDLND